LVGNLEALVSDDTGAIHGISTGDLGLNDGLWHHVAMVQTSKSLLDLYIDGIPRGTDTRTIGAYNASALTIGSFANAAFFKGSIDDVRTYNYALTPTQIKTLYNENSAVRFGPLTGSP
jgi:hypothetical protein